ncbi:unnamed protein product [Gongylonema pulchrum]|uniref:F-box/LRR protein n=1 Tax=Gongylonema pulchrum TaxID=637853 RepID=A0A183EAX0_9BILA|nr:unnamed protein product [Gongylonema pulchrum]
MTIRLCAKLKELYISGLIDMDDETFTHIVSGIPLLRVLDISYCTMLTREGLSALCMLTNLDHLCVNGIYEFDADLSKSLLKSRPSCTVEAIYTKSTMSDAERRDGQVVLFFRSDSIRNDDVTFDNNENSNNDNSLLLLKNGSGTKR